MFSEGFEFETSAGRFVIRDGLPVPAVKRGPLGGELKELKDCQVGDVVCLRGDIQNGYTLDAEFKAVHFEGVRGYVEVPINALCETNIPPRFSGERMTAGDAAAVENISNRWIAIQIEGINSANELVIKNGIYVEFLNDTATVILLPEGFGE